MFPALRHSPDSLPSCCTASHPLGHGRGWPAMWKDRERAGGGMVRWERGRGGNEEQDGKEWVRERGGGKRGREGVKRWSETWLSFCHLFRVRDVEFRLWGSDGGMLLTLVHTHTRTHIDKNILVFLPVLICPSLTYFWSDEWENSETLFLPHCLLRSHSCPPCPPLFFSVRSWMIDRAQLERPASLLSLSHHTRRPLCSLTHIHHTLWYTFCPARSAFAHRARALYESMSLRLPI